MHISQITLRDWKAFAAVTFRFPAPESHKNIVLIGAPNGYGKTSLLEAIILGLFGQDGLAHVARSSVGGGKDRQPTSYKEFLEKALHHGAIADGRHSCSIKLTFEDDEEELLEVQRIWHFSDSGDYRQQDEEIHIFRGSTRQPVGPDAHLQGAERMEWYQEYIAENLLPSTLAHFFIFDGEQVSALANREESTQVRAGIEGLLGLPILKKLATDLQDYARARRRQSPNVSDKSLEKLEEEKASLVAEHARKSEKLHEIEPDLNGLKKERDQITRELSSYGADTQALLQNQFEQVNGYEKEIEEGKGRLEELLMRDVSLALAGVELRRDLKGRLESENARESWESGKKQGDSNLDRFLDAVDDGMRKISPALTDDQCRGVIGTARDAWEKLWFPPPANCAEEYLHTYINATDRTKVVERLDEIDRLGAPEIVQLLTLIAEKEGKLERLRGEIARTENIAPKLDGKRKRLEVLNGDIEKLDREAGALEREIKSLDSQINQKNADLAQMASQMDQAKPSVRRITRALKVASMVDKIVDKAVPSQINEIAKAMTLAHGSMAHKKDIIEKIDIDKECNVKLLNGKGEDVRRYDLSAGEKQIFTQALFSAVSSVSGRIFPMVIDTPLSRLDTDHRKGVLRHLVERGQQAILLSTNTEVVGEYLKEIEPHVQQKYLIHFENIGDIGQSSVRNGYFDDGENIA